MGPTALRAKATSFHHVKAASDLVVPSSLSDFITSYHPPITHYSNHTGSSLPFQCAQQTLTLEGQGVLLTHLEIPQQMVVWAPKFTQEALVLESKQATTMPHAFISPAVITLHHSYWTSYLSSQLDHDCPRSRPAS